MRLAAARESAYSPEIISHPSSVGKSGARTNTETLAIEKSSGFERSMALRGTEILPRGRVLPNEPSLNFLNPQHSWACVQPPAGIEAGEPGRVQALSASSVQNGSRPPL